MIGKFSYKQGLGHLVGHQGSLFFKALKINEVSHDARAEKLLQQTIRPIKLF